ncbi:hypothetical protein NDU88_005628 [Pleurodeles waltl]|uniref:Endonuclease/exonuclease/phosphatase domain-containing protein n=1 Tax=Pleurodeles waltl TaxID=8319 RepID=A0AAV7NMY3_PLEWA|nr:hypothetical protein NDU88_005628 [Pleurodeles waltl]
MILRPRRSLQPYTGCSRVRLWARMILERNFIHLFAHRMYSFFSAAHQTYARIDLFLTSPRITTLCISSAIGVASISDHSPLTLSVMLPAYKPSRLQWRLNTRLITYEDTLAEIRDTISHFLTMNDTPTINIATLWETLKAVVRGQFIVIAERQNAIRCDEHQQLEDDMRALEVTLR